MMLDVDGDGLLDRVASSPVLSSSGVVSCGAAWRRNLGPPTNAFGSVQFIAMPTLKWATPASDPDVYHGGRFPGENTVAGTSESCALNYQESGYKNGNAFQNSGGFVCGDGSTCNASGYCANGSDCMFKGNQMPLTNLSYRWFDIDGDSLPDLVASISNGGNYSYNLQQGTGIIDQPPAPVEPALFGTFPPCPVPSVSGTGVPGPYTMCGGMYPWFVYKNHGNGVFGIISTTGPSPLPDRIIYQPVPIETTTGDSALTSTPVSQLEGTLDVDGDGYPDTVRGNIDQAHWNVYRNDGTGAMVTGVGTVPFFFFTPEPAYWLIWPPATC
jgi:hypothetical protein